MGALSLTTFVKDWIPPFMSLACWILLVVVFLSPNPFKSNFALFVIQPSILPGVATAQSVYGGNPTDGLSGHVGSRGLASQIGSDVTSDIANKFAPSANAPGMHYYLGLLGSCRQSGASWDCSKPQLTQVTYNTQGLAEAYAGAPPPGLANMMIAALFFTMVYTLGTVAIIPARNNPALKKKMDAMMIVTAVSAFGCIGCFLLIVMNIAVFFGGGAASEIFNLSASKSGDYMNAGLGPGFQGLFFGSLMMCFAWCISATRHHYHAKNFPKGGAAGGAEGGDAAGGDAPAAAETA